MNGTTFFLSGPIFFQFNAFVICVALQIQLMAKGIDDLTFQSFITLETTFFEFGLCFSICYFGANLTAKFHKISEIAYNARWYIFSANQKMAIISIMRQGQEPRMLEGLGIFACSLEMFTSVS